MRKILVTGASGFVGSEVIRRFKEDNSFWLRAIDRKPCTMDNIEFIENDLAAIDSLAAVLKDIDCVVHCLVDIKANYSSVGISSRNFDLLLELLEACRVENVRQFVLISSSTVFRIDSGQISINDGSLPNSLDTYGKVRGKMEQLLIQYSPFLSISIIRPHIIIGKDRAGIFDFIVRRLKTNKWLFLPKSINSFHQTIHVKDLAGIVYEIVKNNYSYTMNVGYVPMSTIMTYLKGLKASLKSTSKIILLPGIVTKIVVFLADKVGLNLLGPNRQVIENNGFVMGCSILHDQPGFQPLLFNEASAWEDSFATMV